METLDYIDRLKEKIGARTDYQLSKAFPLLSERRLSEYRNRKKVIDDYTAARIAEELGLEPFVLVAAANAERAARKNDQEKAAFWGKFARTALVAGAVLIGATATREAGAAGMTTSWLDNNAEQALCALIRAWLRRLARAVLGSELDENTGGRIVAAAAVFAA